MQRLPFLSMLVKQQDCSVFLSNPMIKDSILSRPQWLLILVQSETFTLHPEWLPIMAVANNKEHYWYAHPG